MVIYLNERKLQVDESITAFKLRDLYKKDSDILILNGFPINKNMNLVEGDRVTLIKRGEIPSKDDLEALMIARHTPLVHEKVKGSKVLIAGLGGLGSSVALALARVGVGHLRIIDFDVVEPSNLNRQQYFVRHIGMKKAYALKEIIEDINPFIEVEAIDKYMDESNLKELCSDVDVVVEAFDRADNKAMLVNYIIKNLPHKKVVAASGMAGYYSSNSIVTRKIFKNIYLVGDGQSEAKIGEGLMAPRVGVTAHHQANMVLRLLLGGFEPWV